MRGAEPLNVLLLFFFFLIIFFYWAKPSVMKSVCLYGEIGSSNYY